MPFTGFTVKALGKHLVRITGATLVHGATGTIGLDGDTGVDIQLPPSFPRSSGDPNLAMSDVVEWRWQDTLMGGPQEPHIHTMAKSDNPFRLSIMNDSINQDAVLELYIQFHHSLVR